MSGYITAYICKTANAITYVTTHLHVFAPIWLWVVARCSDDLAAVHYRLVYAVPMVGLWPTTEPNHIFYWDYNRLKARFGWSHAVPMT